MDAAVSVAEITAIQGDAVAGLAAAELVTGAADLTITAGSTIDRSTAAVGDDSALRGIGRAGVWRTIRFHTIAVITHGGTTAPSAVDDPVASVRDRTAFSTGVAATGRRSTVRIYAYTRSLADLAIGAIAAVNGVAAAVGNRAALYSHLLATDRVGAIGLRRCIFSVETHIRAGGRLIGSTNADSLHTFQIA